MKKIATAIGTAALFAAAVFPALATGQNCSNGTTGALSTNYCEIENKSEIEVTNTNDAQIVNQVSVTANTGNNSASFGTLGGSIWTGNATLNTTVTNVANVNTTSITGGPAMSSNNGQNSITGYTSDNRVEIENELEVEVENSNTLSIFNDVDTRSNTGFNNADYNTGPSQVRTGDARQWTTVSNWGNDNATAINAGAGGSGGNNAENNTTGALSTNYVEIENEAEIGVENINDAIIGNFVRTLANSGFNSTSFGTLGGDIDSGDATSGVSVGSTANLNTTAVEVAMGGFSQNASNEVTGYNSDNRNEIANELEIEVENLNNKCESHNADRLGRRYWDPFKEKWVNKEEGECDVSNLGVFTYNNDVANTGENFADFNTGGGVVWSGWAELWKEVFTRINDTVTVIKP